MTTLCVFARDIPISFFAFFAPVAVNSPVPNRLWLQLCRAKSSFENWGWEWRDMPPFSSSVGERKIMNHFVVKLFSLFWLRRSCGTVFI